MLLIKSYLACFYYNIIKAGSYNIDNYKDRQRAERKFTKKKKIDSKILALAEQQYQEELLEDMEEIRRSKELF